MAVPGNLSYQRPRQHQQLPHVLPEVFRNPAAFLLAAPGCEVALAGEAILLGGVLRLHAALPGEWNEPLPPRSVKPRRGEQCVTTAG